MNREMQGASGYYDWLAETLRPLAGRRILEVGPGFGDMAERLGGASESYVGLDNSEEVVAHLAARFKGRSQFHFILDKDLGAASLAALKERRLDTVIALNLLEHLPVERTALRLWSEVCPGGRLLAFAPALPFLYGSLDEGAGHYRRYTRKTMRGILESAGVEVESVRYFNAVGALGWFVSARILRQKIGGSGTAGLVRFYDRFALPLARLSDPLLSLFWGQSVLAVGRFP
ncbi:MAG: methyltransferase [Elusimicrobiota bacterium]